MSASGQNNENKTSYFYSIATETIPPGDPRYKGFLIIASSAGGLRRIDQKEEGFVLYYEAAYKAEEAIRKLTLAGFQCRYNIYRFEVTDSGPVFKDIVLRKNGNGNKPAENSVSHVSSAKAETAAQRKHWSDSEDVKKAIAGNIMTYDEAMAEIRASIKRGEYNYEAGKNIDALFAEFRESDSTKGKATAKSTRTTGEKTRSTQAQTCKKVATKPRSNNYKRSPKPAKQKKGGLFGFLAGIFEGGDDYSGSSGGFFSSDSGPSHYEETESWWRSNWERQQEQDRFDFDNHIGIYSYRDDNNNW